MNNLRRIRNTAYNIRISINHNIPITQAIPVPSNTKSKCLECTYCCVNNSPITDDCWVLDCTDIYYKQVKYRIYINE